MEALHSKYVYRYFTQEAIDRSHGAVWNILKNSVDSPNDREIDALDDVDPEFDFSRFSFVDTDDATVAGNDTGARVRPHDVEGDDDSLSTMRTAGSLPTIAEQALVTGISQSGSISSTSTSSHNKVVLAQLRELLPGLQQMASTSATTAETTVLRTGLLSVARLLSPSSEAKAKGGSG